MLSKTMPASFSRKFLEEYNKELYKEFNDNNDSSENGNDNNNNSNSNDNNNNRDFSSSPLSYYSSYSRSISPEPTYDSIISGHSLHRQPTFTYIPIHKRRHSTLVLSRSMSFNSTSLSSTTSNLSSSSSIQTPESEMPTTPTSLCSSHSAQ